MGGAERWRREDEDERRRHRNVIDESCFRLILFFERKVMEMENTFAWWNFGKLKFTLKMFFPSAPNKTFSRSPLSSDWFRLFIAFSVINSILESGNFIQTFPFLALGWALADAFGGIVIKLNSNSVTTSHKSLSVTLSPKKSQSIYVQYSNSPLRAASDNDENRLRAKFSQGNFRFYVYSSGVHINFAWKSINFLSVFSPSHKHLNFNA